MWSAISIRSNEKVRSAIVNCLCPQYGGPIEPHSQSVQIRGTMWKTVASHLGESAHAYGSSIRVVTFFLSGSPGVAGATARKVCGE